MRFNGSAANIEAGSDFAVRKTFGGEIENLLLPQGEISRLV